MNPRVRTLWVVWAAPVFMLIYLLAGAYLGFRRHDTFHTDLLDLGYYTQIVWNTSQGRLFANTIPPNPPISLLDHFAPALALIAPLFWIAPDARTLQFVTVLALTVTMIPAYLLVRERYPLLGPLVILALVLNPMGQLVTSLDFHELILATPPMAFALYALYKRRTKLLLACLALVLICREDMGLFVASFGLFLLLFRPGQRWLGVIAIVVGVAWTTLIIQVLLPSLGMPYRHTNIYSSSGTSLFAIAEDMLTRLPALMEGLLTPAILLSFLRVFAPLAFLPFIALGEQVLWVPAYVLIMLTPGDIRLFTKWHISAFLGLMWVSVAITIARLPVRWAKVATAALTVAAIAGFIAWSAYPGGGAFDPAKYLNDEHAQIGQAVLAQVSPHAAVAAQSKFAVHLAARSHIVLFPWMDPAWTPDMILLDETDRNPYPLTPDQLKKFIREYEARPDYKFLLQRDGYIIFAPGAQVVTPVQQPWEWGGMLSLENFATSQTDRTKAFEPMSPISSTVTPGSTVRVELYWKSLAAMQATFVISVRLLTSDNQVVAQDDSWPARGLLSTLQWPVGQQIRDVHYLSVSPQQPPGPLRLQVLVYNADTQARLGPQDGYTLATYAPD